MHKTLIASMLAAELFIGGVYAEQPSLYKNAYDGWYDEFKGISPSLTPTKDWAKCAADAVAKDFEKNVREGTFSSDDTAPYGAAGDAGYDIATKTCGYLKADLPPKIADHQCVESPEYFKSTDMATMRGNGYLRASPEDQKQYDDACKAKYNSKKSKAIRAKEAAEKRVLEAKRKASRPWSLVSARTSEGGSYVNVLIKTDKNRRLKCALINSKGDYIAVDTGVITPPVDQMMINRNGMDWDQVQCTEMPD